MEPYKWYKANEILPENTDFPKKADGMEGFYIACLDNGDIISACRWYDVEEYDGWYWDSDCAYDNHVKDECITHWMRVEAPAVEE